MKKLFKENTDNFFDSAKQNNPAIEELIGIIKYRDLVFQLIYRDIVARYKRSVLGVAWTMLNPLGTMVIIMVVFSQLFHSLENYSTYVLSGLIVWNFFSQTTTASMQQTVWGASLFNRIYLPRTTFMVSALGTGLVNFLLSMIPLGLIMVITGVLFTKAILILPLSIFLLASFALGIGLLVSSIVIFFSDITDMYYIALTAWMYLTPIFYPPEILPDTYRTRILEINPMYHLIQMFRLPIYEGKFPEPADLIFSTSISLCTLLIGWYIFSNKASKIAYV
jgi:ABC-2 type transport system permease protein